MSRRNRKTAKNRRRKRQQVIDIESGIKSQLVRSRDAGGFGNPASGYGRLTAGGIRNSISGMGTGIDKTESSYFQPTRLATRTELEVVRVQSWAADKFISIPVDDMFIRWRKFKGSDRMAEAMRDAEMMHKVRKRLATAMKMGRLFGTGLLVLMSTEAPLDRPLEPERIRAGDLKNLLPVDRFDVAVHERDIDPYSPTYGQASLYRITPRSGAQLVVDASRVLRFDGIAALNPTGWQEYDEEWGVSELIPVIVAILQEASTSSATAHLVQETSIPVIRMLGYKEALEGESAVDPDVRSPEKIAEDINLYKSIYRTLFLDSGDEAQRLAVNWSGLPDILDRFARRLAAAAGIPATRFWGQSPIGMNATGEGDMVNYAYHVGAMQEEMLTEPLLLLDEVLMRDAGLSELVEYEWVPLLDISESDQAGIAHVKAQAVSLATADNLIGPEEAREALSGPVFGELDPSDVPEPPPEPEPIPVPVGEPVADVKRRVTPTQRRLVNALEADIERLTPELATELGSAFADLGALAQRSFTLPAEDAANVDDATGLSKRDLEAIDRAIERMHIDEWKTERLEPVLQRQTLRTAQSTLGQINSVMNLGVGIPDPRMRQIVRAGGKRIGLIDVAEDTKRAIFHSLTEGRIKGEGAEALGRRIRSNVPAGRFVNAGPKYRARMIARTETKHAQNVSSLEGYKSSPVVTGVVAIDAQLPDTDADCIRRNGTVYTLEKAALEDEHPNGTLSWAPTTT